MATTEKFPRFIRQRGYLIAVCANNFGDAPAWGFNTFFRAIDIFNRLSQTYKLGVTFKTPRELLV